jgi:hypothetical protein
MLARTLHIHISLSLLPLGGLDIPAGSEGGE